MSQIGIVIQREYLTRVRKPSFIILTLLMPVLFVGLIVGTIYLSKLNAGEIKHIVVVDETKEYLPVLQNTDQYHFIEAEEGFQDFRKNSDEDIYATLIITGDLLQDPSALTLYSRKQVVGGTIETITSQLNKYLSDKKINSYNIPELKDILEKSKISVKMQTIRWDDSGKESESSAEAAMSIGMIFTFLIYLFIFSYGGMVMSGVLEEKTNRIVEVMVSSVKPFDLMMGKLIGIGFVGLTQFGLWGILITGFTLTGATLFSGTEAFANIETVLASGNILILCLYFVLFFIGGYLIYASLFAAIGAMVNSQEDTQQFMMPISVFIGFAFYAGFYSSQNPDGPLAFWTSFIPLTSPIVMMTRLPYGVPWWELVLSIGLLIITVILIIQLTAKIYRIGILMYGKKPSFSEIMKWLKY
ncbi:MAG: ABC transporter permease [Dysgonamonadaceae bacterium]|jgi:ABC-2 type transport system permease protein|nr:ABC transporter permease [Dysgonamonadaceae bacterium]